MTKPVEYAAMEDILCYSTSFTLTPESVELYQDFLKHGEPVLMEAKRHGKKGYVYLKHGSYCNLYALPKHLWKRTTWIVTCNPQCLVFSQRHKHVFPEWKGPLLGFLDGNIWKVTVGNYSD